jgi:hypothetical protein
MAVEKGRRIIDLVIGSKAELCVELGVFGGRALICMAFGLKVLGRGRADGIDPYTPSAALEGTNDKANSEWWSHLDYEAIARVAQETLYRLELMPYARLVRMRSLDVVDFYADGTIDLLHQDSNHSEEVSREEVARWAPKIRSGGFWVFDDTDWASTQKAQRDLEALRFRELENHGSWKVYLRT